MRRFVHLPVVGRFAQRAFLSKMEDIAVMALAFCHSHEITLRDLEMYGVLQVSHNPGCMTFSPKIVKSSIEDQPC